MLPSLQQPGFEGDGDDDDDDDDYNDGPRAGGGAYGDGIIYIYSIYW